MPKFTFQVTDLIGACMKITIEADSERDAVDKAVEITERPAWWETEKTWDLSQDTTVMRDSDGKTLWNTENGYDEANLGEPQQGDSDEDVHAAS